MKSTVSSRLTECESSWHDTVEVIEIW